MHWEAPASSILAKDTDNAWIIWLEVYQLLTTMKHTLCTPQLISRVVQLVMECTSHFLSNGCTFHLAREKVATKSACKSCTSNITSDWFASIACSRNAHNPCHTSIQTEGCYHTQLKSTQPVSHLTADWQLLSLTVDTHTIHCPPDTTHCPPDTTHCPSDAQTESHSVDTQLTSLITSDWKVLSFTSHTF